MPKLLLTFLLMFPTVSFAQPGFIRALSPPQHGLNVAQKAKVDMNESQQGNSIQRNKFSR